MVVTYEKFVDRLNRSGLLSTQGLQELLKAVPDTERPGDAETLARWLVARRQLSPFQARAVFVGHTKGLVVGNYVILDLLGVGGMGQVYKARHRRMKRIVAIKILSPEVSKDKALVSRFHREVEAAAKLMHPNIVTAFDADEADGKHFLVMEYVRGRDLGSLVKERGRLSVNRSIRCVLDAAKGLEYAHRHGIIHRDIKPTNLLLTEGDADVAPDDPASCRVKILDLGLARIDTTMEKANRPSDLTRPGIVMGTVDYMAPEQAVDTHDADHRSDVYSLGITLHFLITARLPYIGRTVVEQVVAHREAPIPSLKEARSSVPAAIDPIFRRMVAKQPGDRYQSMSAVVADLESLLSADESDGDLPVLFPAESDDAALSDFLDSMSGDETTRPSAATSVMASESAERTVQETIITSNHSTTVDPLARVRSRRRKRIAWGPILLHTGWSLGLLAVALWLFWTSRPEQIDAPARNRVVEPQQEAVEPGKEQESLPAEAENPPAANDDALDVTFDRYRGRGIDDAGDAGRPGWLRRASRWRV